MREDETDGTAAEPNAQHEQPAPEAPAPAKRTRRRSSSPATSLREPQPVSVDPVSIEAPATPSSPPVDAAEEPAEKPRKRAARRRAGKPETAVPATTVPEVSPDQSATEDVPGALAPVVEDAEHAAFEQTRADQPPTGQPPAGLASSEDPPAEELPAEQAAEQVPGDSTQAPKGEQGSLPSLAPALSHVDSTGAEIELAAPAAFNPFAVFVAPEDVTVPAAPARREQAGEEEPSPDDPETDTDGDDSDDEGESGSRRRRRGRRGRGRKSGDDTAADTGSDDEPGAEKKGANGSGDQPDQPKKGADDKTDDRGADSGKDDDSDEEGESTSRRRRRRRRRGGDDDSDSNGNGSPSSNDKVKGVTGSVRLEAKRQRRKEGRDAGRRRAPILTEAEFLARRESVTRRMVVRQQGERTQIAVLEDDVLVEHYVTLASEQSFAGGVYYGRVQNVLPSMEAAFVDIGKRRNAVLYAGEVNWDAAGLEGKQRNIEQALKSGDKVLVQVTKDPIGHKGARLTSQISLPGRYLVYVPGGSMTGISRKLPEGERQRLKDILRKIVPDDAGVIIRTAAEGASEEELTRDVERLKAQWEVIEQQVADTKTKAPSVLYEEPDLAIRVVRDLFNEDFSEMVISGADAWDTISGYMQHVAPDLVERIQRHEDDVDVFAANRIDEQLTKALDRKVWLPSGGSLVIDHTEAMTVIDVNTGKFTGSGGNLEQTVTKNNLEAAEEIVRQLRLRDVGGIVVIDFIDMLLESNRELVLRRLTECLGRDRTKHQVAEVTSLGLVQMTRKRVGQGLLDAFSEPCPHCEGRGLTVHAEPVEKKTASPQSEPQNRRGRSRRGGSGRDDNAKQATEPKRDSTVQLSAIAAASKKHDEDGDGETAAPGSPAQPVADAAAETGAPSPEPAGDGERLGDQGQGEQDSAERRPTARRRRAARRPAGPPTPSTDESKV
ncbi:Rne/Rng family ribonuclease [Blastococcus sp. Marseille-P5729]|uniref:Rne/Rng family ribonuclease n=1 Tax=Blastococcus sp. Marseille-P5729 TaxID=2086582 RepID=UPI000D104832|nr:Rne/Rng family ribonuclease [Blastococcus sp. Marseille-P5729]